jgi:hypothetical protein
MQQRESVRFKPGDHVRIKRGYSRAILPGSVGRVERAYQSLPGYYDVRVAGEHEARLMRATELERWVAAFESVLARWRGLD